MKEITVISENNVGVLADICNILGHAGVNMEAISAQGIENKGVIRLITSDPVTAEKLLKKKGYNVIVGDVIIIKVPNLPGELGKVTSVVAREGINIETVYLMNKDKKYAYLTIKPFGKTDVLKGLLKGYVYE